MLTFAFLLLFLVPAIALCWRLVVTKTHAQWRRVGAAAAAMITVVGAFVVYDNIIDFDFKDWRNDIGLLAAMSGSIYLLLWARHRGNSRHRTVSIIAAIVGLVPVVGAVLSVLLMRVD